MRVDQLRTSACPLSDRGELSDVGFHGNELMIRVATSSTVAQDALGISGDLLGAAKTLKS